jgi:hypothetical protein
MAVDDGSVGPDGYGGVVQGCPAQTAVTFVQAKDHGDPMLAHSCSDCREVAAFQIDRVCQQSRESAR